MKCLILAAGYATRLYPLTENYPKPLLPIRGKSIIDWLLDDLQLSKEISEFVLVSNHKYVRHFEDWAKDKPYKITIIDDGTETNETRLGAVRDIQYAIGKMDIDDDLLVIAGDNVLDFSLIEFIAYCKNKKTACVMRYYESNVEKLKKAGVLSVDDNDIVIEMVEKPSNPATHWCCPPFYFYPKEDLPFIEIGINEGCSTDAPGSFVAWLYRRRRVHAMLMPGKRYDIGDLESYEAVQREYGGIK
ncbi:MAG: nucleotidyltransferase family protein [Acholeplasmataceae bacterium]|nr:nucleotidyltransferase family protein [Acholeplasmataceae bacterium]